MLEKDSEIVDSVDEDVGEEVQDEDDGSEMVDDFQGKTSDISCTVDLKSGDLADVLSEKDSPVPIAKKTPTPVVGICESA